MLRASYKKSLLIVAENILLKEEKKLILQANCGVAALPARD
jgi:hypothetical protein